jgi:hypothetical protein
MEAHVWWLGKRQNAKEKNAPIKYINVGLRPIKSSLKYFDSNFSELFEK